MEFRGFISISQLFIAVINNIRKRCYTNDTWSGWKVIFIIELTFAPHFFRFHPLPFIASLPPFRDPLTLEVTMILWKLGVKIKKNIASKESFHIHSCSTCLLLSLWFFIRIFFWANIEEKVIWRIASSHAMTAVQQDGLISWFVWNWRHLKLLPQLFIPVLVNQSVAWWKS